MIMKKMKGLLKPNQRLLRVEGPTFVAGAVFEKRSGKWQMVDCAPYLRKIIGTTEVNKIGLLLKSKGFKYEWIDV